MSSILTGYFLARRLRQNDSLRSRHGYVSEKSNGGFIMTGTKLLISVLCLSLVAACAGEPEQPASTTASADTARPTGGGYRIYVTNEVSGDMSIIDPATHEVVATAPLGKRPRGIHASPDRQTIYVALSGSPIAGPGVDESKLPPPDKKADGIGVYSIRDNKLVKVLEGGSDPEEFDLSSDGTLLYTSNEDTAESSIVDVTTGKVTATLKVGEEPEGVTTSPDGKFVYVTSENDGEISVIDTAARKVLTEFKVGARPRDVAFSADSSKAYVSLENDGKLAVVDAKQHKKVGEIEVGKAGDIKPMAIVLSKDGSKAYTSTGRGKRVYVIDTATDKVTGSFEVGERPWGLALSPDEKYLYTANGPSNDVSVVDLATQSVVKRIKVGERPWGVLVLAP
jgi:YVTN family beta-propeller protein